MLWWFVVCIKKGIQDKGVKAGKNVLVCIAAVGNMGILHLVLPTGDYQDLRLLT
jgi:hypothetical protein